MPKLGLSTCCLSIYLCLGAIPCRPDSNSCCVFCAMFIHFNFHFKATASITVYRLERLYWGCGWVGICVAS